MKAVYVWGAPCSGKSSYVKARIGDSDVRYDYDDILQAITNQERHLTDKHAAHQAALDMRTSLIRSLEKCGDVQTAYIISHKPHEWLLSMLRPYDVEIVKIEATKQECLDRLEQDERRPDKAAWREVIEQWFADQEKAESASDNIERKREVMNPFYNFSHQGGDGGDVLTINGEIVSTEDRWDDDATAATAFRRELAKCKDVTVVINSPGGDVFAGAAIYTALLEHKGRVVVKVVGIAASAASVIAMAGDEILMSPVAYMMIHDPWTFTVGSYREHDKASQALREIGEGIVAAYSRRTGKTRDEILDMMEQETYMSAQTCIDLGFADGLIASDQAVQPVRAMMQAGRYARGAICAMLRATPTDPMPSGGTQETQAAEQARRKDIALRASAIAEAVAHINENTGGKTE